MDGGRVITAIMLDAARLFLNICQPTYPQESYISGIGNVLPPQRRHHLCTQWHQNTPTRSEKAHAQLLIIAFPVLHVQRTWRPVSLYYVTEQ